ncbi:MAG: dihydrodipicolinate synthase family protein, partial [Alphaproteobacteria bacterium]|nr:dihydrodipicolinate synthase family protein [Alphaproteobacteria bacterium]
VTPFAVRRGDETVIMRFRGGLLGHWCVWVKPAVEYLARAHQAVAAGSVDADLLQLDSQITDANSALFDVVNDFAGVIAGCHEVLRRQGLLRGTWCLNPDEAMSPGQADELDRVISDYPHLCDDDFVAANVQRWLD